MYLKSDFRWWTKSDPHESAWDAYSHIKQNDGGRYVDNLRHLRLYGNRDYAGVLPSTFSESISQDRVTLNVIKSVCDTVSARIAKNRPRPVFLTSGGNYSTQRRAKLLEKFVESQFYTAGVYKVAPKVFRDCCVFGTGVMQVYNVGTQIRVERVFPGEIYVDQAEGMYGDPKQIYRRKYINRDVLLDMFPNQEGAIRTANGPSDEFSDLERDSTVDQIEVVEAWHLPSGPDAKDGKHCIILDGGTLLEESWDHDYFPFVFIHWSERLRGYWGMGLAEELTGIQVEINKLLMKIQKAFQLLAVPWVLVEAGSKIKKARVPSRGDYLGFGTVSVSFAGSRMRAPSFTH